MRHYKFNLFGIFSAAIFFMLISMLTIYAQTSNYPKIIQPLSDDSLKNLIAEFKIVNNETICNTLDKYGYVSSESCQPKNIIRKEMTDKDAFIEMAKNIILKNSKFTGITDKSNLIMEHVDELQGCILCDGSQGDRKTIQMKVIFKNQIYNDLEIEDTRITVFGDIEKIYRIDGHGYSDIVIPENFLSEEQSKEKLIGKVMQYEDISGNSLSYTITEKDLTKKSDKIILPIYSGDNTEIRLAWKIPIGENEINWHIYVDSVTGEELKIQQNFMSADGGIIPKDLPPNNNDSNSEPIIPIIDGENKNSQESVTPNEDILKEDINPATEGSNSEGVYNIKERKNLYWILGILFLGLIIISYFLLKKKLQSA